MSEHDHEYKAVKYAEQEAVIKHWEYKDHHMTTLNHERVKLFCIKCGDYKDISAQPKPTSTVEGV